MIHAREDYNNAQKLDEKIPVEEPCFLVRGQDEFCEHIIKHYILLRVLKYGTNDDIVKSLENFLPKVNAWPKKKKADL